jgi:hypothetical protein
MTGPDTLTIGMTEDAYAGDAQAEIMLDGQLLGTPTVTYLNSGGTAELFTYTGNFGGPTAQHTALVNFLNDLYIGPGQDRNLYVQSITFDGVQVAGPPTAIMRDGPVSFGF